MTTATRRRGTPPQEVTLDRDRYDAVIFDMDGVVTDTARVHATVWKLMFDRYLVERSRRTGTPLSPFDDADYLEYVDGKGRDDGVAAFLASRGIELPLGSSDDSAQRETVWGLANRKNRDFQRVIAAEGVRAFPSSVTLVRSLQRSQMGTAIISASRNCQQVLEAAGIGDLFPVRVDGIEAEKLAPPGQALAGVVPRGGPTT